MQKYIYQGNVRKSAKLEDLTYFSNAKLNHNNFIEVIHDLTWSSEFYTQQEFDKLFTIKNKNIV